MPRWVAERYGKKSRRLDLCYNELVSPSSPLLLFVFSRFPPYYFLPGTAAGSEAGLGCSILRTLVNITLLVVHMLRGWALGPLNTHI